MCGPVHLHGLTPFRQQSCCCAGGLQHLPGLRSLAVWAYQPLDLGATPRLESLTVGGPNGAAVHAWPDLHGLTQLTNVRLTNMHPSGASRLGALPDD